jgi:putative nucleotidyltransferase with HDIG domain
MSKKPNRQEAYELLTQYVEIPALIKHALMVEGVMKRFARLLNEDEDKWGVIGLLHDIDYEKYPEQHCKKAVELLEAADIDAEYIHAICSHGYGICSNVEPVHVMEKVMFTIDELTGLIHACAIMRPSKSVMDLEYKSVIKKFKQASFAAGVDRAVIERGVAMLDYELKYVIEQTILGMRDIAVDIGLSGNA